MGWMAKELGLDSWQGQAVFLSSIASRPELGSTQPPIQWVPVALSLGVKWQGCEDDNSTSIQCQRI
jgi:hypothetical protein